MIPNRAVPYRHRYHHIQTTSDRERNPSNSSTCIRGFDKAEFRLPCPLIAAHSIRVKSILVADRLVHTNSPPLLLLPARPDPLHRGLVSREQSNKTLPLTERSNDVVFPVVLANLNLRNIMLLVSHSNLMTRRCAHHAYPSPPFG